MDSLSSGLAKSSLNEQKFRIQQSIPNDSIKRGPYAIVRSADLNDSINILRRFGEGSKPLFEREDITVNQASVGDTHNNATGYDRNNDCKTKQNRKSSSTESSSPERYRHREGRKQSSPPYARCKSPERSSRDDKSDHGHKKHSQGTKYNSYTRTERSRKREKSKSRSLSPPKKKKTPEKLPYYRDELRERDRKRRLYGHSRSRSPTSNRRYSPMPRRHISPSRRRSSSRDKYRRHLMFHSSKGEHKSRRSRTRSKSRSPPRRDRERYKHYSSERNKEKREDLNALPTTAIAPQIIPIAVPVPADYGYPFPGWTAPQAPWHTPQHRPSAVPHFTSIPMFPMMPSFRAAHQAHFAGLPPPLHYGPMPTTFRPHTAQRYPAPRHNYHIRSKKPST